MNNTKYEGLKDFENATLGKLFEQLKDEQQLLEDLKQKSDYLEKYKSFVESRQSELLKAYKKQKNELEKAFFLIIYLHLNY